MFKLLLLVYFVVIFDILLNAEGSFLNVHLVRRRSPRQNLKIANEHGLDIHALENTKNATNYTLALQKYLDNEFYGFIRVGSRSQQFQVIFDTAWTTSWIMSKDCPPSVDGCKGHQLYDHDRSDTYVRNGTKYSSREGDEVLSGYYSRDKINFGGCKLNQTFVEMTQVPASFMLNKADGLIGLSPSFNGEKTVPEMLYEEGWLKQPIFSIFLNRDYQSSRGGDIMLGAINEKHIHVTNKVKDKVTYVQVDSSYGQWAFKIDSAALIIAKKSIPLCTQNCDALVDTGSINIYAPKEAVDEINYRIHATPDDDKFAVDCDKINKLPPFSVVIGGQTFLLKGKEYTHRITIRNVDKCYSVFMPGSDNQWVLGGAFLARYFSIYNFQSKVIGFVRAA